MVKCKCGNKKMYEFYEYDYCLYWCGECGRLFNEDMEVSNEYIDDIDNGCNVWFEPKLCKILDKKL